MTFVYWHMNVANERMFGMRICLLRDFVGSSVGC